MRKKFIDLIEVRKIIALLFSLLFVYLSVIGKFTPEIIINVILMVIGYYFGKSTALDKPPKDD